MTWGQRLLVADFAQAIPGDMVRSGAGWGPAPIGSRGEEH